MSSSPRFIALRHTNDCALHHAMRAPSGYLDDARLDARCTDECRALRTERDSAFGGEQLLPVNVADERANAQDGVITDIEQRKQLGIARYGQLLVPHNGRDALLDTYQELLDAAIYTKQVMMERDSVALIITSLSAVAEDLTAATFVTPALRNDLHRRVNDAAAALIKLYPRAHR